jgi:eukaryotic-like serine/threonine-protein kinase
MTDPSHDAAPTPGQSHGRSHQDRGSTVSMTSTATGLPDRYRPLDQVGPDEPTPTGVIRCWRAKDRVLNRDVAIRVHTPAGPAAHAWIARALTAGGLATPALAMVYDASEGSGDPQAPGGAAYVVNEWIDGITLADRLTDGPMPDRDVRTVLRRLAEGIAEAHRVGLAVGGLTADNVVLRPNGLVGLRAVPAATGTIDGDIAALGALLEACLTGLDPADAEPQPLTGPSDLVALVRRARSTEPGQSLSSVAAMAALLAERPRTPGASASASASSHRQPADRAADKAAGRDSDSGWLRRLRDRRTDQPDTAGDDAAAGVDAGEPVRLDPHARPPVPPARPVTGAPLPPGALGGDTIAAGTVAPNAGAYAEPGHRARHADDAPTRNAWTDRYEDDADLGVLDADERYRPGGYGGPPTGEIDIDEDGARRHRFVVIGLPLIALVVVVALAVWLGKSVLSVAGNVDEVEGSTPSVGGSSSAADTSANAAAPAGSAIPIVGADVFDPGGDGEPENPESVELAFDGDPATSWSTVTYRGSPAFGNLKDGIGLLFDLGGAQEVAGVELTSAAPGANVQIRVAERAGTELDAFTPAADGTIDGTTRFAFDEPATAGFVLVWITGLVPSDGGFAADIAEVEVQAAG